MAAAKATSTFARHAGFPAHALLPAAFLAAALIFRAAQDALPVVAASNAATQSAAVSCADAASPGHAPDLSALANRISSVASTFARQTPSTSVSVARALAWQRPRAATAPVTAFAFAPAHVPGGAARMGAVPPASSTSPSTPLAQADRERILIGGLPLRLRVERAAEGIHGESAALRGHVRQRDEPLYVRRDVGGVCPVRREVRRRSPRRDVDHHVDAGAGARIETRDAGGGLERQPARADGEREADRHLVDDAVAGVGPGRGALPGGDGVAHAGDPEEVREHVVLLVETRRRHVLGARTPIECRPGGRIEVE